MRFTTNCRSHQHERLLDKGIDLEEIRDAEKLILKTTQKECFKVYSHSRKKEIT